MTAPGLGVNTDRLAKCEPAFLSLSRRVEQIRSGLDAKLQAAGECWGGPDDKLGKAFAEKYVDPAKQIGEGLTNMVEVLSSVADGIRTMTKGAVHTEEQATEQATAALRTGVRDDGTPMTARTAEQAKLGTAPQEFTGVAATRRASASAPLVAGETVPMTMASGRIESRMAEPFQQATGRLEGGAVRPFEAAIGRVEGEAVRPFEQVTARAEGLQPFQQATGRVEGEALQPFQQATARVEGEALQPFQQATARVEGEALQPLQRATAPAYVEPVHPLTAPGGTVPVGMGEEAVPMSMTTARTAEAPLRYDGVEPLTATARLDVAPGEPSIGEVPAGQQFGVVTSGEPLGEFAAREQLAVQPIDEAARMRRILDGEG